jgi:hypothetical protein
MSFPVTVLGHRGNALYEPDLLESRVSTRWLRSASIFPSTTSHYLNFNVTFGYPGGGFTFRHRFAIDDELKEIDFLFSRGWLQLCSRHIPGVSLELSNGSSLTIPPMPSGSPPYAQTRGVP